MSNYFGQDAASAHSQWNIRVREGGGKILVEQHMDPIPPAGSRRVLLKEVFPDIEEYARAHAAIAIEVNGTNIQGPFTFVTIPIGDFNIHHFC